MTTIHDAAVRALQDLGLGNHRAVGNPAGYCGADACTHQTCAMVRALDERGLLNWAPPRPRVWRTGEQVPPGTWVLGRAGYVDRILDEDDPNATIALSADGGLVEVLLPDHATEVERDAAERAEAGR